MYIKCVLIIWWNFVEIFSKIFIFVFFYNDINSKDQLGVFFKILYIMYGILSKRN